MTAPVDPAAAADALLGRAIAVLGSGAGGSAPSVGRSADEQVGVTLAGDGTVRDLDLDPRVLRGGADELAARIVEAVNAAVDAREPVAGSQAGGSRAEQLRALQEDTLVQAAAIRTALQGELERLVTGAREES